VAEMVKKYIHQSSTSFPYKKNIINNIERLGGAKKILTKLASHKKTNPTFPKIYATLSNTNNYQLPSNIHFNLKQKRDAPISIPIRAIPSLPCIPF